MKKLENNYHTHTTYCRHSSNEIEALIKFAIQENYKVLGISEHCPYPLNDKRYPSVSELDELIEKFLILKEKYAKDIELHFGLETEYYKPDHKYYRELKNKEGVEYFIFGNHYLKSCLQQPTIEFIDYENSDILDLYIEQIRDGFKSNLFSALAHPDIFFKAYRKWDDHSKRATQQIIELSTEYDIPLELNGNGLFYKTSEFDYPVTHFWKEVSKSKAQVIISTDAHSLELMKQSTNQKLFEFAKKNNIEKNIITKLNLK
ncbi:MAG: PHP domain-containing protein [Malacoplasma sp.]